MNKHSKTSLAPTVGQLLTTREAAKRLGLSAAFLERDRWQGPSIPYVRIGARTVRYSIAALEAYLAAQVVPAKLKEVE